MFLKFFPAEDEHAERFVTNLAACQLSMALLQSYFMLYRDSAEQASAASAELALRLQGNKPAQQVRVRVRFRVGIRLQVRVRVRVTHHEIGCRTCRHRWLGLGLGLG